MKSHRVINHQSPMLLRSTANPLHPHIRQRYTQQSTTPPPPPHPGINPRGTTSPERMNRQSPILCPTDWSLTTRRCTTNMTLLRHRFPLNPTSHQNLKRFQILKSFQNTIQSTRRHTTIQLFHTENPTHQKSQMCHTITSFQSIQQQLRQQQQQPTLLLRLLQQPLLPQLRQQQPQQLIQLQQQQQRQRTRQQPTRLQQLQPRQQLGINQ